MPIRNLTYATSKVYSFPAMKYYYAGIGSRSTPGETLKHMDMLAACLGGIGYVLRTGGADGADTAFLSRAQLNDLPYENWVPWRGFNGHNTNCRLPNSLGIESVDKYHPAAHKLSSPARLLMARNFHQVMGGDGETPVDFVICWTPDGKDSGGTGQAIRIAEAHGIPVVNLQSAEGLAESMEILAICIRKIGRNRNES